MSLDDLLEREGPGDDRLQAAISQALVDETFTTLQSGRVERDLRHPIAAQDDELSQQLQGGDSRRLRTQGPVEEDDAVGHRRSHELLHGRATHGGEDDPGALATGHAEDVLDQIPFFRTAYIE